jgi:hypothetical protein
LNLQHPRGNAAGVVVAVASGMSLLLGVAAFAVTRLLSSLLFEVKANDPLTHVALSAGLAAAAALASCLPALRATSVDPVEALRASTAGGCCDAHAQPAWCGYRPAPACYDPAVRARSSAG